MATRKIWRIISKPTLPESQCHVLCKVSHYATAYLLCYVSMFYRMLHTNHQKCTITNSCCRRPSWCWLLIKNLGTTSENNIETHPTKKSQENLITSTPRDAHASTFVHITNCSGCTEKLQDVSAITNLIPEVAKNEQAWNSKWCRYWNNPLRQSANSIQSCYLITTCFLWLSNHQVFSWSWCSAFKTHCWPKTSEQVHSCQHWLCSLHSAIQRVGKELNSVGSCEVERNCDTSDI